MRESALFDQRRIKTLSLDQHWQKNNELNTNDPIDFMIYSELNSGNDSEMWFSIEGKYPPNDKKINCYYGWYKKSGVLFPWVAEGSKTIPEVFCVKLVFPGSVAKEPIYYLISTESSSKYGSPKLAHKKREYKRIRPHRIIDGILGKAPSFLK